MNVIPATHLTLIRARKSMEKAFKDGDWDAVKDQDVFLSAQLAQAFDDPERNHRMLADELSKVLGLYSRLTIEMPEIALEEQA